MHFTNTICYFSYHFDARVTFQLPHGPYFYQDVLVKISWDELHPSDKYLVADLRSKYSGDGLFHFLRNGGDYITYRTGLRPFLYHHLGIAIASGQ